MIDYRDKLFLQLAKPYKLQTLKRSHLKTVHRFIQSLYVNHSPFRVVAINSGFAGNLAGQEFVILNCIGERIKPKNLFYYQREQHALLLLPKLPKIIPSFFMLDRRFVPIFTSRWERYSWKQAQPLSSPLDYNLRFYSNQANCLPYLDMLLSKHRDVLKQSDSHWVEVNQGYLIVGTSLTLLSNQTHWEHSPKVVEQIDHFIVDTIHLHEMFNFLPPISALIQT